MGVAGGHVGRCQRSGSVALYHRLHRIPADLVRARGLDDSGAGHRLPGEQRLRGMGHGSLRTHVGIPGA